MKLKPTRIAAIRVGFVLITFTKFLYPYYR
ncbi:hypothetical protein SAMN04515624_12037 [Eubacterium maltosivorans]|nr:hypothetical protein EUMA32_35380 [Eubacterium maltosivorans]SDP65180.1 hypothetical protein SAMN04515624_12037 [Eubacterium maltosivorans]